MSAPEKIFVTVEYIGKTDTVVCGAFGTYPMDESVEFTRTDLSQAAVAAALEAAARVMGERQALISREQVADLIRALITQPQHDALAAHVAAEVAKARAEDAVKIEALVDTVKRLNAACDAMWNDPERLEKNAGYFAGQQPWQLKDAHMRAISEAQQASLNTLNQIGAKP